MQAEAIIDRARALLGTRFRFQGRDPATGLGCVGLATLAVGSEVELPGDYALRTDVSERWIALLDRLGRRRRKRGPQPGDILLFLAGPAQLHLGLWTGQSLIHADARLRRVVELPGCPDWPLIGAWSIR